MFKHAAVQGALAIILAVFFASSSSWATTAQIVSWILNLIGIRATYVSTYFLMYVNVLDGFPVGFQVLLECSGLLLMVIFGFISVFTIGLLKGPLSKKLIWFSLSLVVGFMWNVNRLVFVISVAYYFGLTAFSIAHFILAPAIDFIWIVSMWSLGISWLKGKEAKAP
jgi:exosortase/archaeosortase family protein